MPSLPPNSPAAEAYSLPATSTTEFSADERTYLLKLAHEAIESALENRPPRFDPPASHLTKPRGVFTTVYLEQQLRGCVGYVFPVMPLYQAVIETAQAAATKDTRFAPVIRQEAPYLQVSLSILSGLTPITPEQIEIGRHGLVISLAGHRGLLLPQVPVEHHWDRIQFLEQTCRKAGLPLNAWKAGATLEAFTAEVFADEGSPE